MWVRRRSSWHPSPSGGRRSATSPWRSVTPTRCGSMTGSPAPMAGRVSWRRRRSSARRASTPAGARTGTATWATPGGCPSPCRAGCCGVATPTASPRRPRPTPSCTSAGSSYRSKPSPPSSSPRPGGSTATSTASCWPRTTRRCSSARPSATPPRDPAPAGTAPADHPPLAGRRGGPPRPRPHAHAHRPRRLRRGDVGLAPAPLRHRLRQRRRPARTDRRRPAVGRAHGGAGARLDRPERPARPLAVRYRGVVTVGETVTLRAWADGDDLTQEVRAGERLVATGTSRVSTRERG